MTGVQTCALPIFEGLSPNGGPDFQALATWVFDVYLSERLRGISPAASWVVMENQIRGRQ